MSYTWDHIHLRSPDPRATAAFFVEMFGAAQTGEVMNGDKLRVVLKLDGMPLFIEEVPADTAAPPTPPFLGYEHIGLRVPDIEAEAARLKAKGVTFVMEPKEMSPVLKIAFIEGPEKIRIELLERKAG